ncbi:MAG TPA: YfhO family protein [Saprospiraceae bacterium]|nr:YfhO family protein [Saprospiraceae bacterium]
MIKKIIPHIVAVVLFYVLCVGFFYPGVQGQKIYQSDVVNARSMSGEEIHFKEQTGDIYYWNNSMFAGMPWRLLTYGREQNMTKHFHKIVYNLGLPRSAGFLFLGMLFTYLVLVLLKVNPWLSMIGAIGFAYNTNYVVLLEAGHMTKIAVLICTPLIFGGSLLAFRKQPIWGSILFGLGCALAIFSTHIQMLYYMALLMVVFYLVYAGIELAKKQSTLLDLAKPLGFLVVGALLALASGSGQLYSSQKFSTSSIRGGSVLEQEAGAQTGPKSEGDGGLDWDYANAWSNDFRDLAAMLIPRFIGGSSAEEVPATSEMGRLLAQNNARRGSDGTYAAPMYWGDMPFTSGPSYFGAIIIFLFVLSLFVLPNSLRWASLIAVFFGILLSMGRNAEWIVRPLFDHLPLYDKFRTPSSLLSVFPALLVIPAMLGLQDLLTGKNKAEMQKKVLIAAGIVGGFCLLFALIGSGLYSFLGDRDTGYQAQIQQIFIDQRQSFLKNDALRSFGLILVSAGLLYLYLRDTLKTRYVVFAGIGLLVVIDLFSVGRWYLDKDNYVSKREYDQLFEPRPVDQQIFSQEPKGRGYYRVFDLSINTFNDASTSMHHNTIGGYYAAKLQRIQDLIEYHISQNNQAVLNMLNAKYIITQQQQVQVNSDALGNAWFVNDVVYVETPREEIDQLNSIDPGNTAVMLKDEFSDVLEGFQVGNGQGSIELTQYTPDRLVYTSNSNSEQLAVFSEVWYGPDKGWTVTVDGEEIPMLRANYILRSAIIPAGQHEVVFEYKPQLPGTYTAMSLVSSLILMLGFFGYGGYRLYQWAQQPAPAPKEVPSKKTTKSKGGKAATKTSSKRKKKK